jgi:hypothetical protein
MSANGRWDLTRRLKGVIFVSVTLWAATAAAAIATTTTNYYYYYYY